MDHLSSGNPTSHKKSIRYFGHVRLGRPSARTRLTEHTFLCRPHTITNKAQILVGSVFMLICCVFLWSSLYRTITAGQLLLHTYALTVNSYYYQATPVRAFACTVAVKRCVHPPVHWCLLRGVAYASSSAYIRMYDSTERCVSLCEFQCVHSPVHFYSAMRTSACTLMLAERSSLCSAYIRLYISERCVHPPVHWWLPRSRAYANSTKRCVHPPVHW